MIFLRYNSAEAKLFVALMALKYAFLLEIHDFQAVNGTACSPGRRRDTCPLSVVGPWVAVRSEERAVFLVNVKGLEAFLLTATFGTPAGSG